MIFEDILRKVICFFMWLGYRLSHKLSQSAGESKSFAQIPYWGCFLFYWIHTLHDYYHYISMSVIKFE